MVSEASAQSLEALRGRLREIVELRSLLQGNFTLASGAASSFYFNLKETILDPEASILISDLILNALASDLPDCIGGMEMGAVPIAACVGLRSAQMGMPVRPFYVRKSAKGHGTRRRIDVTLPAGGRAVIVEDVTTTGSSAMEAAAAARDAGCTVDTVVTILDRQEGACELLQSVGLGLVPLLSRADFKLG